MNSSSIRYSDYLDLEVRESQIPNSGDGVFALRLIPRGKIICEYRGSSIIAYSDNYILVISSKYCYSFPFTFEDKMVYINEKYSVVGQNVGSKVNDIIDFSITKYCDQQIESIEKGLSFPTHPNYSYNAHFRIKQDKVFLVASRNIAEGEELFLSYSNGYWKFFYDEYKKQKSLNFFEWMSQMKLINQLQYDKFLICDSDKLKLGINKNQEVICKEKISYNEHIIECKGQIMDKQAKFDGVCLKIRDNLKLCVDQDIQNIFKQSSNSKTVNAEIIREGEKYFINSTAVIEKGEVITLPINELKNLII